MKKLIPIIIIAFLFTGLIAGCAHQELTSKHTALWMNKTYNVEYSEYLSHFTVEDNGYVLRPGTTEKQIEILKKKKTILTEVYPLIRIYTQYELDGYVPAGVIMTEVESRIMLLINQLIRVEGV